MLRTDSLRALLSTIVRATLASTGAACVAAEAPPAQQEHEHDAASPAAVREEPGETTAAMDAGQPEPKPVDAAASNLAEDSAVAQRPAQDAASGDARASATDGGQEGEWELVPCRNAIGDLPALTTLARPADSVSIYTNVAVEIGNGMTGTQRSTGEKARAGVACSGVSNLADCEAQIAQLTGGFSCTAPACQFTVVGEGGRYARLDTRAELLQLLGSIDAVAEAVLVAAFDGHTLCQNFPFNLRDKGSDARRVADGYELRLTYEKCGSPMMQDHLRVTRDGTLTVISSTMLAPGSCAIGRRPDGLCPSDVRGTTSAGLFLAQAAQLEAAAVFAFHKLLRELRALGAPSELVEGALSAMLDEVRHAREVSTLARAFGGAPHAPQVAETKLRSRFEIARDNAGEGCVRETFGALVAAYQAERAADPRVRRALAPIAEDEARHAALSWQLQAWLELELSAHERAQLEEERQRALTQLAAELDPGLSAGEREALGFPSVEQSALLLSGLSSICSRADPRASTALA